MGKRRVVREKKMGIDKIIQTTLKIRLFLKKEVNKMRRRKGEGES